MVCWDVLHLSYLGETAGGGVDIDQGCPVVHCAIDLLVRWLEVGWASCLVLVGVILSRPARVLGSCSYLLR